MLGAFSALIIVMLRSQTEVAAVDQDYHQSISCSYMKPKIIVSLCVCMVVTVGYVHAL